MQVQSDASSNFWGDIKHSEAGVPQYQSGGVCPRRLRPALWVLLFLLMLTSAVINKNTVLLEPFYFFYNKLLASFHVYIPSVMLVWMVSWCFQLLGCSNLRSVMTEKWKPLTFWQLTDHDLDELSRSGCLIGHIVRPKPHNKLIWCRPASIFDTRMSA